MHRLSLGLAPTLLVLLLMPAPLSSAAPAPAPAPGPGPETGTGPRPIPTATQTYREGAELERGPVVFDQSVSGKANPKAVAEVKAGKHETVNAAWWGFNESDSTEALQSAINSGAKRVLVPDMGKPWVVEPIFLESDQQIIFEDGVVILAKPGEYRGVADMLFEARGKKNIELRGYGATFKMQREDYADDKADNAYEFSEWRHTLAILGCSDIRVHGLTFEDSGGDGIYVGAGTWSRPGYGPYDPNLPAYCTDIHIRDVTADRNHRQGCSIIGVKNLLIENSRFINTRGTPPQAGIDFEPNSPNNALVNILVRDCLFEGNAGSGVEFHFSKLAADSTPMDIRLDNIVTRDNLHAVYFSSTNAGDHVPSGSRITFYENCEVDMRRVRMGVSKPKPGTFDLGTEAGLKRARTAMFNIDLRFNVPKP